MIFTVEMKRTQTTQVRVEANSLAEAKRLLADQETRWEYFSTEGDAYVASDIKIVSIKVKDAQH